jgi:phage gp45-like
MHRATPANSSFRAFVAGGARSIVDKVDDSKLMQEMAGNFMKGETRSAIEAAQNYGFTSVTMDADKDKDGNITGSAETFMSFMGGNRAFPAAGAIDDRRHRLKDLEKGDVAMFRTKDDQQQFHLTGDGGFWSAPEGKTVRMQLVPKKQQQQQQQPAAGTHDAGGGSSGGSSGGGGEQQNKPTGQQAVRKDGKDSAYFVDVTTDKTTASGKTVHLKLADKNTYVHVIGNEVYLGGEKGKHKFALVVTVDGPSSNVYARLD